MPDGYGCVNAIQKSVYCQIRLLVLIYLREGLSCLNFDCELSVGLELDAAWILAVSLSFCNGGRCCH